jgi:hypothetical protein
MNKTQAMELVKIIQNELSKAGLYRGKIDGIPGPMTSEAWNALMAAVRDERSGGVSHAVKASSFADPADVRAFKRCKGEGKSDQECFKVGDNGIGCWGDDTTGNTPMCALPPEDMTEKWGSVIGAKHMRVVVSANGRTVTCVLGDRMPARKNVKNGAAIDLNPAAAKALGLKPPFMVDAVWKWEGV